MEEKNNVRIKSSKKVFDMIFKKLKEINSNLVKISYYREYKDAIVFGWDNIDWISEEHIDLFVYIDEENNITGNEKYKDEVEIIEILKYLNKKVEENPILLKDYFYKLLYTKTLDFDNNTITNDTNGLYTGDFYLTFSL